MVSELCNLQTIPGKSPYLLGRLPVFRGFFHPLPIDPFFLPFSAFFIQNFSKLLFARETLFSYLHGTYTNVFVLPLQLICSYSIFLPGLTLLFLGFWFLGLPSCHVWLEHLMLITARVLVSRSYECHWVSIQSACTLWSISLL